MPDAVKLAVMLGYLPCTPEEAEFSIHGYPFRFDPTKPRFTHGKCTLYGLDKAQNPGDAEGGGARRPVSEPSPAPPDHPREAE